MMGYANQLSDINWLPADTGQRVRTLRTKLGQQNEVVVPLAGSNQHAREGNRF